MDCVKCGTEVRASRQPSIHNECLRMLEQYNEDVLFNAFPQVFSGKRLVAAQGMAIECEYCYRLAITNDLWLDLPNNLRLEVRAYDVRYAPLKLCNQCRLGNVDRSRTKVRRRRTGSGQ